MAQNYTCVTCIKETENTYPFQDMAHFGFQTVVIDQKAAATGVSCEKIKMRQGILWNYQNRVFKTSFLGLD